MRLGSQHKLEQEDYQAEGIFEAAISIERNLVR
jgi:hypothetical protein